MGTRGYTFELIVLGSGGGPLETDCSGYLLKPINRRWEDGFLALEGGSGLGALVSLFREKDSSDMFPDLVFPSTHNTPVLKAAYVFSFLECYLITHAHLDHNLSLILLSGSSIPHDNSQSITPTNPPPRIIEVEPPPPVRPPVYAIKHTLDKLAMAYGGDLWPQLGSWAQEELPENRKKRRKTSLAHTGPNDGSGLIYSLILAQTHRPLHPTLPITTLAFPVNHGCTSKGTYESSAFFIRYDPETKSSIPLAGHSDVKHVDTTVRNSGEGREFLFFGDVESGWRSDGELNIDQARGEESERLNRAIWDEAATSWIEGRLAGVFIECSYDSSRPQSLMFGHLSPPGLYHELTTLATLIIKPLKGLRIFVTHMKENLLPHPSGRPLQEIIMSELVDLEDKGKLGVEFIHVKRGDRICEFVNNLTLPFLSPIIPYFFRLPLPLCKSSRQNSFFPIEKQPLSLVVSTM
ncbi:hypothetical protein TREMEDRAFT_35751 [Tremella mesenterica DSM 1558]|uniref:uncharacterized protein n=1 Tax=Tremella mesenterica (strain ATCC 24925 / CBS 8224 / DSM 1558 / NBRC 9311 / NRRL Y-6157 / RJB 2259-6 / UBC 559-6) TaxID=578456 RepID=UPI00032BF51E|nr:uncharacterized protein TREMEDRAFT_35751 [Tremella mesenterica DSM 1558]EIW65931.1 hypothetical protein TREMEDRAFT_35751 [Tremella mesenterica DSM 1558]